MSSVWDSAGSEEEENQQFEDDFDVVSSDVEWGQNETLFFSDEDLSSTATSVDESQQHATQRDIVAVGFDRELFVSKDELNEDFICPICTNVVEDSEECPWCESLFCSVHIRYWLRSRQSCPKCNQSLHAAQLKTPSRILRNAMSRLQLRCPYETHGCKAVIRLDDYNTHIQRLCPFVPVHCLWDECPSSKANGGSIPRSSKAEHEATCPFRIIPCPQRCGSNVSVCHIEDHERMECPRFVVTCSLGCEAQLYRGDLDLHAMECPMAPKPCPFPCCHEKLREDELESHMQESIMSHITGLCTEITSQRALIEAQAKEISALKKLRHIGAIKGKNSIVLPVTSMADHLRKAQTTKVKYRTPLHMLDSGLRFQVEVAFDRHQVSLYLSIQPGEYDNLLEWPFRTQYTLGILDQTPQEPAHILRPVIPSRHPDSQVFKRKDSESSRGHGFAKFTSIRRLQTRRYIVNDTMFIRVSFGSCQSTYV